MHSTAWLRHAASCLRPSWRQLLLALAQMGLISGVELLKPWPLKYILDHVLGGQPLPWGLSPDWSRETVLTVACGSLVGLHVLLTGLTRLHTVTTLRLGQGLVSALRAALYQHVQRLPLAFHQRQQTGDLLYRLTADTEALQTLTIHGFFPLCTALTLLVGMTVMMVQIDGTLTVLALSVCPVLLVSMARLGTHIDRAATAVSQCESAVHALVQRTLSAIRVIQAFTREAEEDRQFSAVNSARCAATLRLHGLITLYTGLVDLILALGTALLVWVGARHVLRGLLSIGDLVVFTAYLAALYAPLGAISRTIGLLESARGGYRRVLALLTAEHRLPEGPRAISPQRVRGAVRFEGITFGYTPEQPILRSIDLEVEAGQTIALVGPTGAGKSTLLHLLPRFYDPQHGRVLLDGVDVREYTLASLRQQIALVCQPPLVFPGTLAENIAYGRPGASHEAIVQAARAACLHDTIRRLPNGYRTLLGEQGATLSDGERQRLTLARALLREAPILILDEPTSSVDAETQALLMEGLAGLRAGRTTFIIAHRLSTVRHAEMIWVMQAGQIVQQGAFAHLIAQPGPFAELYRTEVVLHEASATGSGVIHARAPDVPYASAH